MGKVWIITSRNLKVKLSYQNMEHIELTRSKLIDYKLSPESKFYNKKEKRIINDSV